MACESVLHDRTLVAGDRLLTAHFDLPATRLAPSQARRLVADRLSAPDMPVGTAHVTDTAQLLVSELVTNAVMHARTELHLGITGDDQTLLFAIADGHPDPPPEGRAAAAVVVAPDLADQVSGRGIAIIVALATDFGWRRRDDGEGKVMWFTLTIPGPNDA